MTVPNTPTPEIEPVAWRWRHRSSINWQYGSLEEAKSWMANGGYSHVDLVPLYEAAAIEKLTAERDKWRDAWMTSAHEEAEAYRERDEAIERVAVLETALEPFCTELFNDFCPDETPAWYFDDEGNTPSPVTVGDFRRALAVREAK